MLNGKRVRWILLVVCALGGCTSKDPGQTPLSVEEFVAAVAERSCRSRGACCDAAAVPFDEQACRAEMELALPVQLREEGGTYDPRIAAECLGELEPVCGSFDDDANRLDACEQIYHGNVGRGQPCTTSEECAVGPGQHSRCRYEDGAAEGRCVLFRRIQARRGKVGDACERTCEGRCALFVDPQPEIELDAGAGVGCFREDGLRCDGECQLLSAEGGACETDHDCAGGLYCDSSNSTSALGVCAARLEAGADCSTYPGACQEACNAATFVCGPAAIDEQECRDYL